MIITAQPFFDENEIMEIKCRELAGLVDAHVIVEADRTYTGNPKPWTFDLARFADWPIIYQRVSLPVNGLDGTRLTAWQREETHRKALFAFVKAMRPEVVFWVDTDEIPRISTLGRFRQMGVKTARLEMDDLRYRADKVDRSHLWCNPIVTLHDPQAPHEPNRYDFAAEWPIIPDAGWHFCWMGGQAQILKSVRAISHAEEECGLQFAKSVEAGERPTFDRLQPYPTAKLPDCVNQDPARWPILFQ